ncbi:MAG: NADH-quinone oxidoreductase subunit NuoK [SAR202 cluster bacterium]|nr:NADH-quinone oxidoreductase subunit NuoK [SAR202 cluster bacterium]
MLERLLILSAIVFCIGMYGVLSRRNIIAMLMSIELMFNAVNIALVAISRYVTPAAVRAAGPTEANAASVLTGQTLAAFVIVVAAAEVALGLALLITLVRQRDTVDITQVNLLRR